MGKQRTKKPQSTIQKMMFVRSRLADVHSQMLELEQKKCHNMILLRELGMDNAREVLELALTPRLRKMMEDHERVKELTDTNPPDASSVHE